MQKHNLCLEELLLCSTPSRLKGMLIVFMPLFTFSSVTLFIDVAELRESATPAVHLCSFCRLKILLLLLPKIRRYFVFHYVSSDCFFYHDYSSFAVAGMIGVTRGNQNQNTELETRCMGLKEQFFLADCFATCNLFTLNQILFIFCILISNFVKSGGIHKHWDRYQSSQFFKIWY